MTKLPLLLTCTALVVGCRGEPAKDANVSVPAPTTAPMVDVAPGVTPLPGPAPGAEGDWARAVDQASRSPLADMLKQQQRAGGAGAATQVITKYGGERFRLVNQKDEVVAVLDNGLVVIAKRVSSPVAAVRGYALTGGVYEGKWLGGGLSHLLEHLVAGGTTERRTEAENRNLLQSLGNNSNAYTTSDHTCYFVNTTNDKLEQAVDLVTGWMFGAKITPAEYAREYEVVQRELEMGKGEPDTQMWYLGQMNRYRVSPARVPVIGYQEVIQGLSRDDVYSYFQLAYQPNNIVFSVAADVDPEVMVAAVRQWAGDKPAGRVFDRDVPPEPPVPSPRTVVATFPKLGQAKLELGFPSIPLNHPDLYALDLLATVLGSGESAILVEELRDKQRLVSGVGVSSQTPTYADGTFAVAMRLDADKVAAATDAALTLLEKVKTDGVPAERLAAAKTQMRVARVKRLQTSEEVAASFGEDFISTGDPHFSDRYVAAIAEVTNDQIKDVARRYFDRNKLLTTALLPAEFVGAEGLPKAEELLRRAAPTTRAVAEVPASKVTRVELPDGTILLTQRITTSPLVVMHAYALGGLTAEDVRTNGLGNLTMQMLPRGTKTRNAQQIAEFFDSIGGDLSTDCNINDWSWTASCLKDDFAKAFDVYADVITNPAFPEAELPTMKQRVVAEIQGQDADWTAQAFRFFKKKYYGPLDSPYQFMAVGEEAGVNGFGAAQLRDWYEKKVLPARRVVAIYGDVDPAHAEDLVRKHLATRAQASPNVNVAVLSTKPAPAFPATPTVDVRGIEVQKTEQPLAGVVIGYDARPVLGEPQNFAVDVADTMTSGFGYPTGYLHEILRGRGLVYVVHAKNSPGLNVNLPGTFFVYAGCEPSKVNEVVETILENVARLQGTPEDVNEEWFARSKELVVVSDAMDNQTLSEQAATAGRDELYALGYDFHDRFADRIKAVNLSSVRDVSRSRLARCLVTVSTPAPELVTVKPGARTYATFPEVDLTPKAVGHAAGGAK